MSFYDRLSKVVRDLRSEDQSNKENRALRHWLNDVEDDAEQMVLDCIETMIGCRIESAMREALLECFTIRQEHYLSESEDDDEEEENEDDCSEAHSEEQEESE